jgi:medium-chain acyl-[acyl-carrier-protein] hydrolase
MASPVPHPVHRRWFPNLLAAPRAETRLFCFPHAGAGTVAYRRWIEWLAPHVECVPVQLPGRETRIGEPAVEDLDALAAELAPIVAACAGPRHALFGHSMGALVAFAVAHQLEGSGAEPVHLFVSAAPAPDRLPMTEDWHTLPDPELLEKVARFGAMPPAVLEDRELCALLLPIRYRHRPRPPLSIPITATGGLDDRMLSPAILSEWSAFTASRFAVRRFPGDHFYTEEGLAGLMTLILATVSNI